MANKDAPFGFRSVGKLGGASQRNGGVTDIVNCFWRNWKYLFGRPSQDVEHWYYFSSWCATTLLGIFRGCKFTNSSGDVVFSSHFQQLQHHLILLLLLKMIPKLCLKYNALVL